MGQPAATTERDANTLPEGLARPYLYAAFFGDRSATAPVAQPLHGLSKVLVGRGDELLAKDVEAHGQRQLIWQIPDPRISGTHAHMEKVDGRWVVEDHGSLNGTFVNGKNEKRIVLFDGDVIVMGHAAFVYRDAVIASADREPQKESRGDSTPAGLATLIPSLSLEFFRLAAAAKAGTGLPILLHGPSGAGKEVVAHAIHALSGRRGRFVAINCAAISESLAESELFGHRKGAFSGAGHDHPGLVRSADNGTLFLDEVGDLPMILQGKLLRVLQEHEVLPIGETRPVPVDLFVVAATHRNLDQMVLAGSFRQDLFARLAAFVFTLPPLAERREDLGLIISSILARLPQPPAAPVSFSPAAVRALFSYPWPRNVRELQQCIQRALVLAQGDKIDLVHLPDAVKTPRALPTASASPAKSPDVLASHELRQREELDALLRQHNGNIARVAELLDKHRMQIQRLVKRYGLQPERYRK